jgi:hypothetical protein
LSGGNEASSEKAGVGGSIPSSPTPDKYPVDDRAAVAYTIAIFSRIHRGGGSFCLIAFNDKEGHDLEGSSAAIPRLDLDLSGKR